MARTIGANLTAHLNNFAHTRCAMLRLDLIDGTALGFTDHDTDLTFNLGDGAISYEAREGILPSDVSLSIGFAADNFDVRGPIGPIVTRAALLGGRFDMARARLFRVNWATLADGSIPILKGFVAERRVEGGEFVLTVRSEIARLNQMIGRKMSPYCPGDHDECCAQIAPETMTTVSGVTSKLVFNITATVDPSDHVQGLVTFTDGPLAGTKPMEIFAVSGNTITLYRELVDLPVIGNAVTVKEGAPLTRESCRDRFSNIEWYRGFPDVPGTDQVLKMPIPGNAGA